MSAERKIINFYNDGPLRNRRVEGATHPDGAFYPVVSPEPDAVEYVRVRYWDTPLVRYVYWSMTEESAARWKALVRKNWSKP